MVRPERGQILALMKYHNWQHSCKVANMRQMLLFGFLMFCTAMNAQNRGLGVQFQVNMTIGTPINRIGIQSQLFYAHNWFQINAGVSSQLYFSGLGPKGIFMENRMHLAGILAWGRERQQNPIWYHPLFHQTGRAYSLGYNYFWYWDTRATSQRSGAWGVQMDRSFVYFENDLFAGQGRDRFRTGTLRFMYLDSTQLFALNLSMWTGETRGAKIRKDERYPSARGYRDLSENLYGKYSNGIISLSYAKVIDLMPVGVELGIDNERIRHAFQNVLVHDFPQLLNNNPLRNLHLPMLDSAGQPFLNNNQQKLRKTKLVFMGHLGGFLD